METPISGKLDISTEDLQDKIEALLKEIGAGCDGDDTGYYSTDDMIQKTGLSGNTIRKRLKKLARAGRLERRQVWRTSILSGAEYPCLGYRLKQECP